MKWVLNSDELVFNIWDLIGEYNNITPSIFDSIGVLPSAVTYVKLYFQKLCGLKIDWDLPLPEELIAEWQKLSFGFIN